MNGQRRWWEGGADGLYVGDEGEDAEDGKEGEEGAGGGGAGKVKGHNVLQIRIGLETAAGEEGEEEAELEQRETQIGPMSAEEWASYKEEEGAVVALAEER
eukprot:6412527-Prymnesium_polylepis.1